MVYRFYLFVIVLSFTVNGSMSKAFSCLRGHKSWARKKAGAQPLFETSVLWSSSSRARTYLYIGMTKAVMTPERLFLTNKFATSNKGTV